MWPELVLPNDVIICHGHITSPPSKCGTDDATMGAFSKYDGSKTFSYSPDPGRQVYFLAAGEEIKCMLMWILLLAIDGGKNYLSVISGISRLCGYGCLIAEDLCERVSF